MIVAIVHFVTCGIALHRSLQINLVVMHGTVPVHIMSVYPHRYVLYSVYSNYFTDNNLPAIFFMGLHLLLQRGRAPTDSGENKRPVATGKSVSPHPAGSRTSPLAAAAAWSDGNSSI